MFRYIPLSLILVAAVAGCGSSSSSPATHKTSTTPKTVPGVPPAHMIYFGTSRSGNTVHGTTVAFPKLTNIYWDAHLTSAPTKPLMLVIQQTNATNQTKPVYSVMVAKPNGLFIPGEFTVAQLKQYGLKMGQQYGLNYMVGVNPKTFAGGTILANGYFNLGNSGLTSPPGY